MAFPKIGSMIPGRTKRPILTKGDKMVNQVFIDDKKIKDILTYIQGMRHAEMIRMMFLCSLNGMRSINFAYLQVSDVYNQRFSQFI